MAGATPTVQTQPITASNGGVGSSIDPASVATSAALNPQLGYNAAGFNTPDAQPINRTITQPSSGGPTGDPATDYLNTFQAPKSAEQLAEEKRQQSQGLIDSINAQSDSAVRDAQKRGDERVNQNNAISIMSGLSGSTEAMRTDNTVKDANSKEVQAINQQRTAQLAQIYSKISSDASTEAEQQKQDATKSAQDILARRKDSQQNALDTLKAMAQTGVVDFNKFKSSPQNQQVYNYALNAFGGSEDALRGFMALNQPKESVLSSGIAPDGHTFYQVSKDPITGAVKADHFDLGFSVPQGTSTVKLDNGDLMFIPKDGIDPSKPLDQQVQVYKGSPDPSKALDLQLKGLQIQKAQKDLTTGSDSTQGLAQQLVNGQLAPSELSKRATGSGAYNAVLKAADDYAMQTTGKHFNIAKADRDYKFANQPNTQNTLNYLGSLVSPGGNLDELKNKSDAVNRTTFPALNDGAAWARLAAGDSAMANYQVTATEVADQIAKILQGGGTGSGTSDAKLQQAANMFNTGFSKTQINGIIATIKPLLMNRAKSMVGDNPYLSDYADQFGFSKDSGASDSDPLGLGFSAAAPTPAPSLAPALPGSSAGSSDPLGLGF